LAKDACLSPKDYCDQIEFRLNALLGVRNKDLSIFLEKIFIPLFKKTIESCSKSEIYSENIPLLEQILSPSDFGFHNAYKYRKAFPIGIQDCANTYFISSDSHI
jgi:hypothetical protein